MNKKKMLILDKGEIAQRIISTCKEISIESVVICSDYDLESSYYKNSDSKIILSYESEIEYFKHPELLIKLALENKIDIIHPGYGIFSEDPAFSKECSDNNIILVSPSQEMLNLFSNRVLSRRVAKKYGLPIVPGKEFQELSYPEFCDLVFEIGIPLLLKKSYTGGGKGIHKILSGANLETQYRYIFNNEIIKNVVLEKKIRNPRHIEIQVLKDSFGKTVLFSERECTMQYKNQKIIEESPANIDDKIRKKLMSYAMDLFVNLNYIGLATVEFMLDENNNIYFCEVNPRLQVEHTVTEEIHNIDLVKEQISISLGMATSLSNKEIIPSGHAIQCRIYNISSNFKKSFFGKDFFSYFIHWSGIRVDTSLLTGSRITQEMDSLIAKIISHSDSRNNSIKKLKAYLENINLVGFKTTKQLILKILNSNFFLENKIHTEFLENEFKENLKIDELEEKNYFSEIALSAASIFLYNENKNNNIKSKYPDWAEKWKK